MEIEKNTGARNMNEERREEIRSQGLNLSLFIIFVISFIDLLGFTVILPLMPSIFEYYDSNKEVSTKNQLAIMSDDFMFALKNTA